MCLILCIQSERVSHGGPQNGEAKIRRSVEAQNPQAENELRAIIDNAPVFLWSDLPDGYCDFLNQRWLTYFNLSLQEAQGAGWATLLHPDDAAHHLESWQKSISTVSRSRPKRDFDVPMVNIDGS